MNFVKGSAKAIYAGIVAGLSAAIANASNGFTVEEWLGTILAAIVGFGGTYWVTNSGPKAPVPGGKHNAP
jgi:hypothetical protein